MKNIDMFLELLGDQDPSDWATYRNTVSHFDHETGEYYWTDKNGTQYTLGDVLNGTYPSCKLMWVARQLGSDYDIDTFDLYTLFEEHFDLPIVVTATMVEANDESQTMFEAEERIKKIVNNANNG